MGEHEDPTGSRRRRRRAVGPAGAWPTGEPAADRPDQRQRPREQDADERPVDDDERLRREVPPHHG